MIDTALRTPSPAQLRLFDMAEIDGSLLRLQSAFATINPQLHDRRDPLIDDVIENLVAGYAFVDQILCCGIDLLAMGNLKLLLELNAVVLCGVSRQSRMAHADHLAATEKRFYEEDGAGIRDLMDWYERHRNESPWRLAAGVFIRMLSEPQLFLEGNHRSGALVVSYLLGRAGEPPFVLTPENAQAFFNPATLIKRTDKRSLIGRMRIPGLRKQLARFFSSQADRRYLARPAPIDKPRRRA